MASLSESYGCYTVMGMYENGDSLCQTFEEDQESAIDYAMACVADKNIDWVKVMACSWFKDRSEKKNIWSYYRNSDSFRKDPL